MLREKYKYNNKALMCIGEGVIRAILLAFVGSCVGACLLNLVLVRNFACFGVFLVGTDRYFAEFSLSL